jgi:hypothetical protein
MRLASSAVILLPVNGATRHHETASREEVPMRKLKGARSFVRVVLSSVTSVAFGIAPN